MLGNLFFMIGTIQLFKHLHKNPIFEKYNYNLALALI
jgi:hypothetical protein